MYNILQLKVDRWVAIITNVSQVFASEFMANLVESEQGKYKLEVVEKI